jgi:hypothetical protein
MDADSISDDLTIQQVMLDSIEEDTFDGVEQEREGIMAEIARLTALLEEAKKPGNSHGAGPSSHQRPGMCALILVLWILHACRTQHEFDMNLALLPFVPLHIP